MLPIGMRTGVIPERGAGSGIGPNIDKDKTAAAQGAANIVVLMLLRTHSNSIIAGPGRLEDVIQHVALKLQAALCKATVELVETMQIHM